jgi:hypothetical protein
LLAKRLSRQTPPQTRPADKNGSKKKSHRDFGQRIAKSSGAEWRSLLAVPQKLTLVHVKFTADGAAVGALSPRRDAAASVPEAVMGP